MADAILGLLLDNLNSLILREFNYNHDVREDMRKLADTLLTIRDVLANAEGRLITEKPICNWVTKFKHAAYDAEGVMAEWHTKPQVSSSTSYFLNSVNVVFHCKMAKKTKAVLIKFEEIAKQKREFIFNSGSFPEIYLQFHENRETASNIFVGENIIHMLLNNEPNSKSVTVFPILGMDGLENKTTLTHNDKRVEAFSETRIWVCVSDHFDATRILKDITESFSMNYCGLETLEPGQHKVYLLVLDDVWNENQHEWSKLKGFLEGRAQGSSIILTTHSLEVATVTGTVQPCNLASLPGNDCWSLMKNSAFGGSNEVEHHLNLVPIGKAIAISLMQ